MFRNRDMAFFVVILVVSVLAVLLIMIHPGLQPMRNTLAFRIIVKLIPTVLLLYFAWKANSRPNRFGQILMTLMASVPWQGFLFSRRLVLLIVTVLTFAGIIYLVYLTVMREKSNKPLCFATATLFLVLLWGQQYYTYLDGKTHYWLFCLVLALLAGAATSYFIHRGLHWLLDEDTVLEKISACFIVAFIVFALSWSAANNMNYCLDFSEPEEYSMTIVDKQVRSNRGGTYYKFVLIHDGSETELNVSQSTYYSYEIGDPFPVELHQGFFGDAYYIAE